MNIYGMPNKQQLRDAASDLTISDLACEGLENLIEEYGDQSFTTMHDYVGAEAESLLWADDDCFDYLKDNGITDWDEAYYLNDHTVLSIARFYLTKELDDAIGELENADYESEYAADEADEGESAEEDK